MKRLALLNLVDEIVQLHDTDKMSDLMCMMEVNESVIEYALVHNEDLPFALIIGNNLFYNGYTVVITSALTHLLSERELIAVLLHELGHAQIGKELEEVFKSQGYLIPYTEIEVEVKADDFAIEQGYGCELISALKKVNEALFIDCDANEEFQARCKNITSKCSL